mmetsp:Transcript_10108/g.24918  ORF Transcript_10108/g.24918 Transcript_10108/m.24918 type:complete len:286 (-) Transcript_10108:457-1314(-)
MPGECKIIKLSELRIPGVPLRRLPPLRTQATTQSVVAAQPSHVCASLARLPFTRGRRHLPKLPLVRARLRAVLPLPSSRDGCGAYQGHNVRIAPAPARRVLGPGVRPKPALDGRRCRRAAHEAVGGVPGPDAKGRGGADGWGGVGGPRGRPHHGRCWGRGACGGDRSPVPGHPIRRAEARGHGVKGRRHDGGRASMPLPVGPHFGAEGRIVGRAAREGLLLHLRHRPLPPRLAAQRGVFGVVGDRVVVVSVGGAEAGVRGAVACARGKGCGRHAAGNATIAGRHP